MFLRSFVVSVGLCCTSLSSAALAGAGSIAAALSTVNAGYPEVCLYIGNLTVERKGEEDADFSLETDKRLIPLKVNRVEESIDLSDRDFETIIARGLEQFEKEIAGKYEGKITILTMEVPRELFCVDPKLATYSAEDVKGYQDDWAGMLWEMDDSYLNEIARMISKGVLVYYIHVVLEVREKGVCKEVVVAPAIVASGKAMAVSIHEQLSTSFTGLKVR